MMLLVRISLQLREEVQFLNQLSNLFMTLVVSLATCERKIRRLCS